MVCTLDQLQSDVMSRLGENPRPLVSYEGLDIPSPANVIRKKIASLLPEIGSRLIMDSPSDRLGVGEPIEEVATMRKMPCGLFAGEVALPEDFLRLVAVKMEGWKRNVAQAICSSDMEWNRQWSAEAGIAGCPDAPRAYLVCEGNAMKLRLMGSEEGIGSLEFLRICRSPSPDAAGTFHLPQALYPPLLSEIVTAIISND